MVVELTLGDELAALKSFQSEEEAALNCWMQKCDNLLFQKIEMEREIEALRERLRCEGLNRAS